MTSPMLTVRDVATALNFSTRAINKWAKQGRIPAIKVGKNWRFEVDEFEAFRQQLRKRRAMP